jgi:hypothetical protein
VTLSAEQESRMRRRLRQRYRHTAGGFGGGALAYFGAGALAYNLGVHSSGRYWFLTLAIPPCGILIGRTIGEIRRVRKNKPATRVAHARSIGISDYVGPAMTTVTRGLALSPLALAGVMPFLPGPARPARLIGLLVVSLLVIGYMVAGEALQHWMVDQPQRAATEEELILEDALRAETLESLVTAPAMLGVLASCVGWTAMGGRLGAGAVPYVFFIASAGSMMFLQKRFEYRFHEKIWAHRDHA